MKGEPCRVCGRTNKQGGSICSSCYRREHVEASRISSRDSARRRRERERVNPCGCGCGKLGQGSFAAGHKAASRIDPAGFFWSHVDKSSDCWLWTGFRDAKNYGRMRWKGTTVGAHRASYEMNRGPIPEGLYVMHICDNPPCVRPDHLAVGTNADNGADMARKGRAKNQHTGAHH